MRGWGGGRAGRDRGEFYSVSVTLGFQSEGFTFNRESERERERELSHSDFIFIYERPIWCSCLGNTRPPRPPPPESRCSFSLLLLLFWLCFASLFLFVNVWISIWERNSVGLNVTPRWAVCASRLARGGREETPHGVAMVITGFYPIKVASFTHRLPNPSLTLQSQTTRLTWNAPPMPTKQGKLALKKKIITF